MTKKTFYHLIFCIAIIFNFFTSSHAAYANCERSDVTCSTPRSESCYVTGTERYCCTTLAECTALIENSGNPDASTNNPPGTGPLHNFEELTNDQLDAFNPLKIANSPFAEDLSTPGGILSRLLIFAFPAAGLILFVMIFWGGFEMLSGAASKKSLDAGKQRITAAIIGFLLLFISFWLVRILEAVFGIKVF